MSAGVGGVTWVVGAGGIGAGIAAELAAAGGRVVVIDDWAEHVETIRRDGLVLGLPDGEKATRPDAVLFSDADALADAPRPDLVLLAVKSDRTASATRMLVELIPPDCPVVSLQNGLNEPVIADIVGSGRTIGAVVRFDGALAGPGRVTKQRPEGDLVIGAFDPAGKELVPAVAVRLREGVPVVVSDDIRVELWSKLARNCMLNAVSTLVGLGLGRMAALPEVRTVCLGTGLEVITVARAAGVAVEPSILYGADVDRLLAGDPPEVAAFHTAFADAYAAFPTLKPSMLQDAEKGRTVEVRWLNGAIVHAAEPYGIATPLNEALTTRVEELVDGRRSAGPHNLEGLT